MKKRHLPNTAVQQPINSSPQSTGPQSDTSTTSEESDDEIKSLPHQKQSLHHNRRINHHKEKHNNRRIHHHKEKHNNRRMHHHEEKVSREDFIPVQL
eukprot:11116299-Ditylum_brightwellii.AAC.1